MKNIAIVIGLLATLILLIPKEIDAALKNSIQVSPAFIDIDKSVPQESGYPISIKNNDKSVITVNTKFVPFTPSKKNDGSLDFHTNEKSILQGFLSLSQEQFEIAPDETKTIYLVPNYSTKLLYGDYNEAVIFSFTSSENKEGVEKTSTTSINSAIALTLFVRNNPKAAASYAVKPQNKINSIAFTLPTEAQLVIENMGNTYGIPRGEVELSDFAGRVLARGIINTDSTRLLPASGKNINVVLNKSKDPLPMYLGVYTVKVRDSRNLTGPFTTYKSRFIGIDPVFMVIFILGTIVFVSIMVYLRYEKGIRHKYRKS
ncbi:MAG: hypothetical protein U0525_01445 [Patescibacteria group bacterium]